MRKMGAFLALAYGITWLIWLPLYAPKIHLTAFPIHPYQHMLGGLGPALAAIIIRLTERRGAKKLRVLFSVRKPVLIIAACVTPFAILAIAYGAQFLANGTFPSWKSIGRTQEFPTLSLTEYVVINLLFFGFGEEIGWRGFALPHLLNRFSRLPALLLLTFFWACWHLPAFLYRPGYSNMNAAQIVGWLLSLFAGSSILAWLYMRSAPSILACAFFHAAMDVAFVSDGTSPLASTLIGVLVSLLGIVAVLHPSLYKQVSKT